MLSSGEGRGPICVVIHMETVVDSRNLPISLPHGSSPSEDAG